MIETLLTLIVTIIGLRTLTWWLQCWQIREYRFDRMRAYFQTKEGTQNLFNFWFFPGKLPRPRITGRLFMILGLFLLWTGILKFGLKPYLDKIWIALIWERTLWLSTALCVWGSKLPVWGAQKILFRQVKTIIDQSENLVRIGITGSYGKSSTKEILVHLLQSHFGKENVLYNPANQNNEVAIARLIRNHKPFFQRKDKRFLVIEAGAYRRGEISQVCQFLQPHLGLLTGINAQHLALFGSQQNIQKAKFELAEACTDKVFFNADSPLLSEVFADKNIHATPIPLSASKIKDVKTYPDKSEFTVFGIKMTLPWSGGFFVQNSLLALECTRELGVKPEEMKKILPKLPPLERALKVTKLKSGATLMEDLYSANPDGVLSAIEHLKIFPGKKIFVGLPLLELGEKAKQTHEQIFYALKEINAEIYWLKSDFANLGKSICDKNFCGNNVQKMKSTLNSLRNGDVILLESKLPDEVVQMVRKLETKK